MVCNCDLCQKCGSILDFGSLEYSQSKSHVTVVLKCPKGHGGVNKTYRNGPVYREGKF